VETQIRLVRRKLLALLAISTLTAPLMLALITPLLSGLPPQVLRLGLINYVIFTPLLLLAVLLGAFFYLRPITQLGAALGHAAPPPPGLVVRARRLAFTAPIHLLYFPVVLTFGVATSADVFGALFIPGYYFSAHFPNSVLATLVAAVISLVISIISRRLLRPVLYVTAGLAAQPDAGPRFALRTRQLLITFLLVLIVVVFLGLLGYNMVVFNARESLRHQYQVVGRAIVEGMSPYVGDEALIAYIETLDLEMPGFAFVLDREGELLSRPPVAYADWWLPLDNLYSGAMSFGESELLLMYLPRQDCQWWLGFVYRIDPLRMAPVARAAAVLLVFSLGMSCLVFIVNHQISDDLTRDIEYVTGRLMALAHGQHVGAERLSIVSLDEVGDLTLAFNALLDRVQAQQEQLELEQQELLALQQVSGKITSILDTQQLFAELIAGMEEVFGYRNTAIFLLDESGTRLEVVARAAYLDTDAVCTDIRVGEGLVGRVMQTGEPLVVRDVSKEPAYVAVDPETRSELVIPLLISDKLVGVFNVESPQINAFTTRDVRIVSSLANQVAIAIHNAQLYSEAEEQRQTATALAQLAWTLNTTLNLNDVLNIALRQLSRALVFDTAAIHLLEGRDLMVVAGSGFEFPEAVIGQSFSPDENNLGYQVMLAQHVHVVADVQQLSEWGHARREVEGVTTIRSWIGAPLVVQGKSIGLLTVDKHEPDFYRQEDIVVAEAFASHIAMAVHNARLYQMSQQRAAEMAKMAHNIAVDRSKLDAILRNIADGLIVTDASGSIIMINPAFETLFGRAAGTLVGQQLAAVLAHPELQGLIHQALQQTEATIMAEISLPDGQVLKAASAAIVDDDLLVGTVSVLRDVTHEKEVDRMKTEFISAVSHELRTPLTSVLGFAKLITRSFDRDVLPLLPDDTPDLVKSIQRITDNLRIILVEGERLTHLINDVLDIAKLESGKVEWRDEPLDVTHMVDQALQGVRQVATAKGLALRVSMAKGLPLLLADPLRIRQLLDNLLSNALKFTETGAIEVTAERLEPGQPIHSWRAPHSGAILLTVQDSGPGISESDLPRIFMRFQQLAADALTDKPRGTGLGLAICREIVNHYKGVIWVESQFGSGATFCVALPIVQFEGVSTQQSLAQVVTSEIRPRTTGMLPSLEERLPLVLIVDDEVYIRSLLMQELERAGYRTLQASTGTEALLLARRHHPALILLDVMMPDISGFDVLRILKSDPATQSVPVVILSIVEDRRLGLALGASDYLLKPVDVEQLLAAVKALLRQSTCVSTAVVAVHERSALEALTAALHVEGYEMVDGYDPRGALLHPLPAQVVPETLSALLANLSSADAFKVVRFENVAQNHTIVVFVGVRQEITQSN